MKTFIHSTAVRFCIYATTVTFYIHFYGCKILYQHYIHKTVRFCIHSAAVRTVVSTLSFLRYFYPFYGCKISYSLDGYKILYLVYHCKILYPFYGCKISFSLYGCKILYLFYHCNICIHFTAARYLIHSTTIRFCI